MTTKNNYLKVTRDKLSADLITDLVSANSCGAVSLFMGTTRDNFEDKKVETLEYEAYESMALKCMQSICEEIRVKWPDVVNIAIFHRLGFVPVKEASIIIATSSPHRVEAIKATEFCINKVKESVPIWKKEYYTDTSEPQWKENKECVKKRIKYRKFDINQIIEVPKVLPHLIQIKATNNELEDRINKFMERKKSDININNIREFCFGDRESEFSCARVDAVLTKRKDSKGHLQVNRVLNSYHRDQNNSEYLTKFIPENGIEERLKNIEEQLNLTTATPKNVYERLKNLENRLLHLESISPEYIQFWDKVGMSNGSSVKKKKYSIAELDQLIAQAEKNFASK